MVFKSLGLTIPDVPPFDRQENWFESFAGNQILPIAESGHLRRFWFTRYGAVGAGKHILFRFEVDDPAVVQPHIDVLTARFPLSSEGYTDYDYASDIGQGQGSRFLGLNTRHRDPKRRGDVAFDFLHASSRLFLDCLSGPDIQGYFELERDQSSGFSLETSMEQFHHLFCNLSGVPTFACIVSDPQQPGSQALVSYETYKKLTYKQPPWRLLHRERIFF